MKTENPPAPHSDALPLEAAHPDTPALSRPLPFLPLQPVRRLDRIDAFISGVIYLGSLGLYTGTLTHGLNSMSGDSSELITKSALVQVAHSPGSPFYVWLGKLFSLLPFGEVATRVNWLSAVLGAVAVALIYLTCSRFVVRHRLAGMATAAIFALSLTFWSQAVIAELYAPNLGFLSVSVYCLLEWSACRSALYDPTIQANPCAARRWLFASVALFGLALGIHLSNLMFVPVFGLFMLLGWPLVTRREAGRTSALDALWQSVRTLDWIAGLAALGLFALTLLPYLWQGLSLDSFPYSEGRPNAAPGWPLFYEFTLNAYAGWRFAIPAASWPDRAYFILHMIVRNFTWLSVPFLALGAWRLLTTRTRLFYLFGGLALANFIFYGTYRVADIEVFFIPGYWALTPLLAAGLSWVLDMVVVLARRVSLRALVPYGAAGIVGLIALASVAIQWRDNFGVNNRAVDVSLRDFYGNVFQRVPEGSWIFHRGASLGYDLLYYTRLYHVRPDLHVVAGPQSPDMTPPPWPDGPAYATTVKRDVFLPAFLYDPVGQNNKWYSPDLLGMFAYNGTIRRGWLTLFKLSPNDKPPLDWLVPVSEPQARPRTPLNVPMTGNLTLLGVDLPGKARPGQPIHVVRYWQASDTNLPRIATVFGSAGDIEAHSPLFDQLPQYLAARQIAPGDLPGYVIRDEFDLIIPSTAAPGTYPISLSTISNRMLTIVLDPAPVSEMLPRQVVVGYVSVEPGRAPDPLRVEAVP